jgi:F-type H+-transporting ATPase subunit b
MPQINQLMLAYASQWFWLLAVLAVIYFFIGKGMIPKITATVDARDRKIADDLAAAEKARTEAEEAEAKLQAGAVDVRADAQGVAAAAKAKAAKDAASRVAKADTEIAAKLATADAALAKSRAKALASVESVASEAVQDIVAKIAGTKVTAASATKAVKAEHEQGHPGDPVATTQAHGGGHEAVTPTALGLDPGGWVALSMVAVFGIMIWKKVPALVAGMLDKQIAGIREQLDAASNLRKEAEALKAEYVAKNKAAAKDAEALKVAAAKEAEDIIAQAKKDATALIARRAQMAEDKIGAAERAAVAEVRAKAANTATAAAAMIIASGHDAKSDKPLIDATIARLN